MPLPNTSPIRLCVMHGDGIGPEITTAMLGVLHAAAKLWQLELTFDEVKVGLGPLKQQGTTFPEAAFEAAKAADGVILGPVSHNDYPPADKGGINPSAALRQAGRSRRGPREHRRLLRRPQHVSGLRRVHADRRRRARGAQDHAPR